MLQFGESGVGHELSLQPSQPYCADRLVKRYLRDAQCGRGSYKPGHVRIVLLIRGENHHHDLHLLEVPFREQGAQSAIDQARAYRLLLAGSSFPLEKAPGDFSGRISLLPVIYEKREEILFFVYLLCLNRTGQDHRVPQTHHCRSVSLFGNLSGFHHQRFAA